MKTISPKKEEDLNQKMKMTSHKNVDNITPRNEDAYHAYYAYHAYHELCLTCIMHIMLCAYHAYY